MHLTWRVCAPPMVSDRYPVTPSMGHTMKFRTLGSTGMTVSVVGVGTWQFGGEWGDPPTQDTVDGIFDAARERQINLIDTAECYGDHLSEQYIGKAIERDRDR